MYAGTSGFGVGALLGAEVGALLDTCSVSRIDWRGTVWGRHLAKKALSVVRATVRGILDQVRTIPHIDLVRSCCDVS